MTDHVLAVDVGGTKIAAGVLDRTGRVVRQAVRPTQEPVFAALRDAVAAVGPGLVAAVGLSCAGPVDAVAGTVSPINIPSWRDFPLRARVGELMAGVPIALAGDGQCMALGEHWLGAGRGAAAMLGMVVSTGVGGGLVLDGRPFAGRSGNAGHVGHVIADPTGDPCSCGARGCVETIASGPNLVRWALAHGWRPASAESGMTGGGPVAPAFSEQALPTAAELATAAASEGAPTPAERTRLTAAKPKTADEDAVARAATAAESSERAQPTAAESAAATAPGSSERALPTAAKLATATARADAIAPVTLPTAAELAIAAAAGDPVALQAFRRGARALGVGIVAAAAVCDLEVVVVGGGVAQAGDVLFEPLRRIVSEFAGLSYLADLRVVPASLGTGAGLAGAAALAFAAL
jgi:glucokinase